MPESVTPTIEIWYRGNEQWRFLHDVEAEDGKLVAILDTGTVVRFKDRDGHGPSEIVDSMTLDEAKELYGEPDEIV